MHDQHAFICSICLKPVNTKKCKIDSIGRPVHEECWAKSNEREMTQFLSEVAETTAKGKARGLNENAAFW